MTENMDNSSLVKTIEKVFLLMRERCFGKPAGFALTLIIMFAGIIAMSADGSLNGMEVVIAGWMMLVLYLLWADELTNCPILTEGRIIGVILVLLSLVSYYLPISVRLRAWNAAWLAGSGLLFWFCCMRRAFYFMCFTAVVCWILPNLDDINLRMSYPLRYFSAYGTSYIMQLFGSDIVQHGTELFWGNSAIAVTAACSGMDPFTAIILIGFIMVWRMKGNSFLRTLLFFSILPCVLIANIARLIVTIICHAFVGNVIYSSVPHQLLGFFMVALAVMLFHSCTLSMKHH